MQVMFTRNTITSKGKARIGDAFDLPDYEAKSLINYGRCSELSPTQSIAIDELENTSFDTDELQNTSIGLQSSDAEPVIRRGRPKKAK